MRLDFKKIEIHSFMSFEDEVFEFDAHKGVTLIRGLNKDIPEETNGSGKTSIFFSLVYSLFGQIPEDVNNKNVVNRYAKDKDMRLVLEFDVDGKRYKIVRGLAKGKQSYLELYMFDEDITKSSITETQDFIERELIRCDMSIFLRTVMLTASQDYNFYKMKKADKKDFVEKLFDISVFGDIYQKIHRDILDLDKNIMSRQNRLIVLNRSEDDYKTRMAQHDSARKNKLKTLLESVSTVQKQYDTLKAKEVKANTEETAKLEDAVNRLQDAKSKLQISVNDLSTKNSKIELALHKLAASKENRLSVISKYSELISKLCDDCRPVVSGYYKLDQYEKEVADIDEKSATLSETFAQNESKRKDAKSKIDKLDMKLTEANGKIRTLTEAFNKANRELILLESKISSMNSDIKKTESETNPFIDLYKTNRANIDAENDALAKIEAKYKYLKFAEGIVSQETLRKFIIADLIGLLNNKIKMYLTKMGSRYTVMFDSDMNYEFITTGGECQFGNFSNGEKTRIMIATSFAFRDFMSIRNGLNTNILVCDEFFDSAISSACLRHITDILKGYVDDYKQNVYIITQRQEIEPTMIDNLIQVVKQNDISMITYPK